MSGDRVGQPAKGALEWLENKQNEQAQDERADDFYIKSGSVQLQDDPDFYKYEGVTKKNAPNVDNKVFYGCGKGENVYDLEDLEDLENKH